MAKDISNLIWVDLEMTGLNPDHDRIIEAAVIITDSDLNILAESAEIAIHQPESLIASMDDWNTKQHHGSGLIERVRASEFDDALAEQFLLDFVKEWTHPGKSPLCGNSVWQDRRFLAKYMPTFEQFLHYRLIDVSTLKELALRWAPKIYQGHQKESTHRALQDIRDSVEELKYYRRCLINIPSNS